MLSCEVALKFSTLFIVARRNSDNNFNPLKAGVFLIDHTGEINITVIKNSMNTREGRKNLEICIW